MLVKDFITKEIPVLKSFDTAEYALALMEDFKLKHLPLLSDSAYQCLVSEKDLLALPDPSATIGEPVLFAPAISENRHLHEALAMIEPVACGFRGRNLFGGDYPGSFGGCFIRAM